MRDVKDNKQVKETSFFLRSMSRTAAHGFICNLWMGGLAALASPSLISSAAESVHLVTASAYPQTIPNEADVDR